MGEFRCDSRIHGIVTPDDKLEVRCRSSRCGKQPGNIVLHYFDMDTEELLETKILQDPAVATVQTTMQKGA